MCTWANVERLDAEASCSLRQWKNIHLRQAHSGDRFSGSKPDVPGSHRPGVFTLWTMTDARTLAGIIDQGIKTCAIIGGGVLGLEAAGNYTSVVFTSPFLSAEHLLRQINNEPRISSTINESSA